MNNIKVE